MTTTRNWNLDEDSFARGLLELRKTPRADGRSPAQVLFGHPLRSSLPAHHRSFAAEWQQAANECDAKAECLRHQAKIHHDATAKSHSQLGIGNHVDIQDHTTKRWNRQGIIVGVGSRREYLVKMGSGRVLWRNRRFLRPHRPMLPESIIPHSATSGTRYLSSSNNECHTTPASIPPPPRRSGRQRCQPARLSVRWDSKSYD